MHWPGIRRLSRVVNGALLCAAWGTATAGLSHEPELVRLALPEMPWEMVVDLPGFSVVIDGMVSENWRQTVATNKTTEVAFSVNLQRVTYPAKLEKCQADQLARSRERGSVQKKNVKLFERTGWVLLEYVGQSQGSANEEMNLFACSPKDDVYIDLHFSKAFFRPGEEGLFDVILSSIRLETRDASVILLERGNALYRAGDLTGATAVFREAIRLKPEFVDAHTALGNALDDSGDIEGALAEYRQALRLQPGNADVHINLGILFDKTGDLASALLVFEDAVRLAPDSAAARYGLARALQGKGNVDRAIREYQVALSLKPDLADAQYFLGSALQTKGDMDGAITAYREAVALYADSSKLAATRIRLGGARYLKNDIEGAIAELQEALRLAPDSATAHMTLASMLNAQGDREGARQECQAALRLAPRDEEIRRACQELAHASPH